MVVSDEDEPGSKKGGKKMIKQYKNIFTGSIFSVVDVDIATAKYIGVFEFPNGDIVKAKRSPEDLENDNYYEVKA